MRKIIIGVMLSLVATIGAVAVSSPAQACFIVTTGRACD